MNDLGQSAEKPKYIGTERQLTARKTQILPAGEPLSPEDVLKRRSEEADSTHFFQGGNPEARKVGAVEAEALSKLVKKKIANGQVTVINILGLFSDEQDNK